MRGWHCLQPSDVTSPQPFILLSSPAYPHQRSTPTCIGSNITNLYRLLFGTEGRDLQGCSGSSLELDRACDSGSPLSKPGWCCDSDKHFRRLIQYTYLLRLENC